ncbi:MAG: sensor diguanylate cyclase [Paenibacillaceae bacterium]|jgi:diguanylate cyclase (GGDEF)-like protein|nr:sensor diguanylate cyclase [Paenibacillaceae bacterium]
MGAKTYTHNENEVGFAGDDIMKQDDFLGLNNRRWNRKSLNSFWWVLLLVLLAEEIMLLVGRGGSWEAQLSYMIIPGGINFAILCVGELLYLRLKSAYHWVVVGMTTLICSVLIVAHHSLDYIQALWILPIVVSIMYFQRRFVVYTALMNFVAFLAVTALFPVLRDRTSLVEWLAIPVILGVSAFVAMNSMERGMELLQELRIESVDKQNLMIQNVIKDKMVRTDPLTGLYNRAALNEHLEMLLRYTDSEGFSLHVAMLDVDFFKSVNDTFGHQAGDQVLKRIASVIREGVGSSDFAARYGGEEFTIVFTDRTLEEVRQVLERIRGNVELLDHPELENRMVTISIGLHPYGKGMEGERLLEHADAYLYQAKRKGRNRICDHLTSSEA